MNNQIKNTANFEKLVKIRIGEPLTAVEIFQDQAIFGSISGYVGAYNLQTKELVYIQEVFEEIIRGIQLRENNGQFNVLVGDHSLVQFNINEIKQKEKLIKIAFTNHAQKKPNVCASTMAFLNANTVAMLQANPTQNKDSIYDTNDSTTKGILQVFQIDKQQWKNYTQMNLPQVSVPFDYDSERLIWLEYKEQGIKEMAIYELNTTKIHPIYTFNKSIEFISHVKLLQNYIIFVQDHLHVKAIQAIYVQFSGNAVTKQSDEEVGLKYSEINKNQIMIDTVDFNCNYIQFSNEKITHNVPLLKQTNVPDLIKNHKYIFDMGYPYYIKSKANIIAFTTDFGLCVFRI